MDVSGLDDSADFRPFFDMVIGILFVLLILIAAQIYFQQTQDQVSSNEMRIREAGLRRAEIATFLGNVARRMNDAGLPASVDLENSSVQVPIDIVNRIGANGLPRLDETRVGVLGTILSRFTGCVTIPRSTSEDCADSGRLHLEALDIETRIGNLPPSATLPRDRFGDLASALLSAELLQASPALVKASTDSGDRVIRFNSALSPPEVGTDRLGGSLSLSFGFR